MNNAALHYLDMAHIIDVRNEIGRVADSNCPWLQSRVCHSAFLAADCREHLTVAAAILPRFFHLT
jgi:hypothetical protein